MADIDIDFDFISDVGQKTREFLCVDQSRAKWYQSVIDSYYKNSEYPKGTIKKIYDDLILTKSKENLSIAEDIKRIVQVKENVEKFLGCIFFPSLFELDAIMRPDISNQLSIYVKKGGNVEMITRVLMEHYRGVPNMINVIAGILKDVLHVNPQEIIKHQVQNSAISIFKKYKMDNLLLTQEKVPKEFKIMFQDPFWVDTIISLSQNSDYSQSFFIAYCMNKICKSHPEKIKSLPPLYISYKSFQNVMQYILSKMKTEPSNELFNTLIKIISTDDLTLIHSALIFHDLPQEAQIKITNKLSEDSRNIFKKINLNMDPACDMQLTNIITRPNKLRVSDLQFISGLEEITPHMKSMIIKKITDVLTDRNSNEQLNNAAIDCLLKITGQKVSEDDRYFIGKCFENIYKSIFQQTENLSTILYSVKFPYLNDIIKEIIIRQIGPSMEEPDKIGQSPQSLILREIAYRFKEKIPGIVNSLIKAFEINNSGNNFEYLSNEIFDIFIFLVRLGYSKIVLKKYSDMMNNDMKSPHLHRTFFMKIIKLPIPNNYHLPAVCNFIEGVTYLFNNPNILNKVVPESSANMLSTIKNNLPDLKRFVNRIPDDINISQDAKEAIYFVRSKIDFLNI